MSACCDASPTRARSIESSRRSWPSRAARSMAESRTCSAADASTTSLAPPRSASRTPFTVGRCARTTIAAESPHRALTSCSSDCSIPCERTRTSMSPATTRRVASSSVGACDTSCPADSNTCRSPIRSASSPPASNTRAIVSIQSTRLEEVACEYRRMPARAVVAGLRGCGKREYEANDLATQLRPEVVVSYSLPRCPAALSPASRRHLLRRQPEPPAPPAEIFQCIGEIVGRELGPHLRDEE